MGYFARSHARQKLDEICKLRAKTFNPIKSSSLFCRAGSRSFHRLRSLQLQGASGASQLLKEAKD
jgi:hypothetical protein